MKKCSRIFVLFLVPVLLMASDVETRVLDLLRTHDPDGLFIVESLLQAPKSFTFGDGSSVTMGGTEGFRMYVRGTSRKDILDSLNTVVHEMCHGFTSRMALVLQARSGGSRRAADAFYIGGRQVVLVPRRGVFPSRLIKDLIPAALREGRFSTYIHPSTDNLGTQVDGIYGLLDEWNAYYHGTRTSVKIVAAFLAMPGSIETWSAALTGFYGTLYACGEFKIYILAALEYARRERPDDYRRILANKAFITAFKAINANWEKLLVEADAVKDTVVKAIQARGYSFRMQEKFFMISSPDGGGSGRGHFLDYFARLKAFLKDGYCKQGEDTLLAQPDDPGSIKNLQ